MSLETSDIAAPKRSKKILSYGAFGVSLAVHMFLLMMVGGVVLIEQTIPRAPFESSVPEIESETTAMANEEEPAVAEEPVPTDMPVTEAREASGATGEVSSVPEMITTDSNPSFSVMSAAPSAVVTAAAGTGSGKAGTGAGETIGGGSRPATKITIFGGAEKTPEAFDAYFYDTKQGKNGRPVAGAPKYADVVVDFVTTGFRPEKLSKYFRSDALYPTRIAIGGTSSEEAIKAFDMVGKATPTDWIVHYHGKIVAPKTATYRFAGYGDDFLYVAIDGKLVLDGCHELLKGNPSSLPKAKFPDTEVVKGWMACGKWIDMVAGQTYEMDVAIGDYGVSFGVILCVQEKGVEYKKDAAGNLILPIFRTDKKSTDRVGRYATDPNGPSFAP